MLSPLFVLDTLNIYAVYFFQTEPLCYQYRSYNNNRYSDKAHQEFRKQSEACYAKTFHYTLDYKLSESPEKYFSEYYRY